MPELISMHREIYKKKNTVINLNFFLFFAASSGCKSVASSLIEIKFTNWNGGQLHAERVLARNWFMHDIYNRLGGSCSERDGNRAEAIVL